MMTLVNMMINTSDLVWRISYLILSCFKQELEIHNVVTITRSLFMITTNIINKYF